MENKKIRSLNDLADAVTIIAKAQDKVVLTNQKAWNHLQNAWVRLVCEMADMQEAEADFNKQLEGRS